MVAHPYARAPSGGLQVSGPQCAIRESMRRLPQCLQPFLTWLTGKPLAGEAWPHKTPLAYCMKATGMFLGGVLLSLFSSPWGLIPGWILTISGARTLQLLILHQCAHGTFSPHPHVNDRLGSLIAVVLLIENYHQYQQSHLHHHHSNLHMSMDDPTINFLFGSVGLRPGMSKNAIWRRVLLTLCSPRFHTKTLLERFHSQWIVAHPYRLCAWIVWTCLVLGIVASHQSIPFLIVWGIPLGPLYNMSSCLRLCSEHRWTPAQAQPTTTSREHIAEHSTGIFLGNPAPTSNGHGISQWWAWSKWAGLMLGYHLPVRLLILVGDTPCHDYHHRQPRSKSWTHYAYARQHDVENGKGGWPSYTEIWGFYRAVDSAFASFSQDNGVSHAA